MSEWICQQCGSIKSTNSAVHILESLNDGKTRVVLSEPCHCGNNEWNVRKVNEWLNTSNLEVSMNIKGELNNE